MVADDGNPCIEETPPRFPSAGGPSGLWSCPDDLRDGPPDPLGVVLNLAVSEMSVAHRHADAGTTEQSGDHRHAVHTPGPEGSEGFPSENGNSTSRAPRTSPPSPPSVVQTCTARRNHYPPSAAKGRPDFEKICIPFDDGYVFGPKDNYTSML